MGLENKADGGTNQDAGVLSGVGGFSGLYSLDHLGFEDLVLAAG